MVYEWKDLMPPDNTSTLADLLIHYVDETDEDDALAVVVEGSAKLMLAGMVTDPTVRFCLLDLFRENETDRFLFLLPQLLTRLVLQFIFPETADIQALRQCLGYFLPVYCFSSPLNQRRMKDVFLSTLRLLISEGDEDGITPSQLTLLFLDWTDPQRAV